MRKKFKNAILYPKDRRLDRDWFVKYQVANFKTGEWEWKKSKGLINLYSTVEEREQEALRYINMLNAGESIPIAKGARVLPPPEAPKNFANTVQLIREYLATRTDIAEKTLQNYRSRVKVLHEWLNEIGCNSLPVGQLTTRLAKRFIEWLSQTKKYKNKTCNNYKGQMGNLWNEMVLDDILELNPWRQFKGKKKNSRAFRSHPIWLQQKVKATLPLQNEQLYMASMVLYYDFIRPAEMRRLHLYNIEWDYQCFRVTPDIAKTDNDRLVIIPDELFDMLLAKGYDKLPPDYYLFTHKGEPGLVQIGVNWFHRKFREYREANLVPSDYKLYGLKHTANTKLGFSGLPPQVQQKHNRHESEKSIQPYITGIDYDNMMFIKQLFPKFGEKIEPMARNGSGNREEILQIHAAIKELKELFTKPKLDNAIYTERTEQERAAGTVAIA